jgi:hypothetical protein
MATQAENLHLQCQIWGQKARIWAKLALLLQEMPMCTGLTSKEFKYAMSQKEGDLF